MGRSPTPLLRTVCVSCEGYCGMFNVSHCVHMAHHSVVFAIESDVLLLL